MRGDACIQTAFLEEYYTEKGSSRMNLQINIIIFTSKHLLSDAFEAAAEAIERWSKSRWPVAMQERGVSHSVHVGCVCSLKLVTREEWAWQ